jgi:hypothetical protein
MRNGCEAVTWCRRIGYSPFFPQQVYEAMIRRHPDNLGQILTSYHRGNREQRVGRVDPVQIERPRLKQFEMRRTMFERFTDRSRRVLVLAQEDVRDLKHDFIGTEHLLLGLIREGDGVAAKTLDAVGVTYDAVLKKLGERSGRISDAPPGAPPFTPRAKKVLELSLREAMQLGHNYIGTEHLLLGLLREGSGVATQVLRELEVELTHVHELIIELMSGQSGRSSMGSQASTRSHREILSGVVRSVGRQLRPDLGQPEFSERAEMIADALFDQLRKDWSAPSDPL